MNPSSLSFSLLAQHQPQEQHTLAEASEHFRRTKSKFDASDAFIGLAFILALTLGIFLLKKLLERSERQSGYRHAGKLFKELCQAHELSHSERRLLRRLAGNQQIEDPGRMFIEPERFDVSRIPESLAKRREEIFALRDRLFASNNRGEVSWLAPQLATKDPTPVESEDDEIAIIS